MLISFAIDVVITVGLSCSLLLWSAHTLSS
jgi:hypothetical protein